MSVPTPPRRGSGSTSSSSSSSSSAIAQGRMKLAEGMTAAGQAIAYVGKQAQNTALLNQPPHLQELETEQDDMSLTELKTPLLGGEPLLLYWRDYSRVRHFWSKFTQGNPLNGRQYYPSLTTNLDEAQEVAFVKKKNLESIPPGEPVLTETKLCYGSLYVLQTLEKGVGEHNTVYYDEAPLANPYCTYQKPRWMSCQSFCIRDLIGGGNSRFDARVHNKEAATENMLVLDQDLVKLELSPLLYISPGMEFEYVTCTGVNRACWTVCRRSTMVKILEMEKQAEDEKIRRTSETEDMTEARKLAKSKKEEEFNSRLLQVLRECMEGVDPSKPSPLANPPPASAGAVFNPVSPNAIHSQALIDRLLKLADSSHFAEVNILVVGKSGAGKSSLIKAITGDKQIVLGTYGPTTQAVRCYRSVTYPMLSFFDSKGFEANIVSEGAELARLFQRHAHVDAVIYCVNGSHPHMNNEHIQIMNQFPKYPVLVVLSNVHKCSDQQKQTIDTGLDAAIADANKFRAHTEGANASPIVRLNCVSREDEFTFNGVTYHYPISGIDVILAKLMEMLPGSLAATLLTGVRQTVDSHFKRGILFNMIQTVALKLNGNRPFDGQIQTMLQQLLHQTNAP